MTARKCFSAVILSLTLLSGCGGDDKFLVEPPPPPPGPPRYSKIYKMDVNTATSFATDVDILWVIDNSGSMGNYQQQVISNSNQFMSAFTASSKLRWKMGLISTDQSNPPYMGFNSVVDYTSIDALGRFNTAVAQLGVGGSSSEMTFTPVMNVLNRYPDWLRKGAYLVLIIVSDEEEQSWSVSTDQFIKDMVRRIGGDAQKFAAFGVYVPESNYGNQKYDEIVRRTGGKTYNLASSDYGTLLAQLGQDLVLRTSTVVPEVMLDQRPKVETIRVTYKGRVLRPGPPALGGEWTYDSVFNVIRIHNAKIIDNRQLNVSVSFELWEPPAPPTATNP